MLPQAHLYRHDEVITPRPFACDVDDQGWLWEGVGRDLLGAHSLHTAEHKLLRVPEMGNQYVFQALVWGRKLVCTLGFTHHYVIVDLDTGRAIRRELPGRNPIVWYCRKTPQNKVLLFERTNNKILVLDAPDAEPRVLSSPFPGQLVVGDVASDGLMYLPTYEPTGLIRFDTATERFVDRIEFPQPECAYTGTYGSSLEIDGVLYFANNTTGALQPLELGTLRWRDPIPTPGFNKDFGWIATAFTCQKKAFFVISTLKRPTRIDASKGMKLDVSGLYNTTDGLFLRFLDAHLVFDPASGTFDYLRAPAQPDGVPLLCYWWTDGQRFVITGIVIPFNRQGTPGYQEGPWIVMQSEPAHREPALGPYDLHFSDVAAERGAFERSRRRSYPWNLPLYIAPSEQGAPLPAGVMRPGVSDPPGKQQELTRRRGKTNAPAYWRDLVQRLRMYHIAGNPALLEGAGLARRIGWFVQRALLRQPLQTRETSDPIAALEAHEGGPEHAVAITLELLHAGGLEARRVELRDHVVAEALYDGGWHILDALCFGADQPSRNGRPATLEELRIDPTLAWELNLDEPNAYLGRRSSAVAGRVLSVEELRADPTFADAFPIGLPLDESLLASEDGYQVLGAVLGPWGTRPYYSFHLGGADDYPPTLPVMLPAVRLGRDRVRLRWAESVKPGGGRVRYAVRVCADRDCLEPVHETITGQTSWELTATINQMWYVEVRAIDGRVDGDPRPWYPAARANFVLDEPPRPGWRGWVSG